MENSNFRKKEHQEILDQIEELSDVFYTLAKIAEKEMKNYLLFLSKNIHEKTFEKTKTAYIETLKKENDALHQIYGVHTNNYFNFISKCITTEEDFDELKVCFLDSIKNLKKTD